jgi:hypothetical protein
MNQPRMPATPSQVLGALIRRGQSEPIAVADLWSAIGGPAPALLAALRSLADQGMIGVGVERGRTLIWYWADDRRPSLTIERAARAVDAIPTRLVRVTAGLCSFAPTRQPVLDFTVEGPHSELQVLGRPQPFTVDAFVAELQRRLRPARRAAQTRLQDAPSVLMAEVHIGAPSPGGITWRLMITSAPETGTTYDLISDEGREHRGMGYEAADHALLSVCLTAMRVLCAI